MPSTPNKVEINAATSRYCYLDFDINQARSKLARTAAFCHATNIRYGLSSNDWRQLGGSELQRIPGYMQMDHEWSTSSEGDIVIHPPEAGNRIVVRLDWETAPLACENFATLCAYSTKSATIGQCGKPLTYEGCKVHRVVPKFIVQGGDFVFGNGSGGESIWGGKKFKDEKAGLQQKHNRRGLLSMGNSGKNSNTSQFFFTLADSAPQCDGKHVVFGELVSGWAVLDALEATNPDQTEIFITGCGLWAPFETPGSGYWYDRPDPEAYTGVSPVFIVRPRVALVVPNQTAAAKFQQVLTPSCTIVQVLSVEDKDNEGDRLSSKVTRLVKLFAVDVVLVAPSVKGVKLLSGEWPWEYCSQDEVVLTAKPVQALQAVRDRSWLVQKQPLWQLEGVV